jgi:hypothetical protein
MIKLFLILVTLLLSSLSQASVLFDRTTCACTLFSYTGVSSVCFATPKRMLRGVLGEQWILTTVRADRYHSKEGPKFKVLSIRNAGENKIELRLLDYQQMIEFTIQGTGTATSISGITVPSGHGASLEGLSFRSSEQCGPNAMRSRAGE